MSTKKSKLSIKSRNKKIHYPNTLSQMFRNYCSITTPNQNKGLRKDRKKKKVFKKDCQIMKLMKYMVNFLGGG